MKGVDRSFIGVDSVKNENGEYSYIFSLGTEKDLKSSQMSMQVSTWQLC